MSPAADEEIGPVLPVGLLYIWRIGSNPASFQSKTISCTDKRKNGVKLAGMNVTVTYTFTALSSKPSVVTVLREWNL